MHKLLLPPLYKIHGSISVYISSELSIGKQYTCLNFLQNNPQQQHLLFISKSITTSG